MDLTTMLGSRRWDAPRALLGRRGCLARSATRMVMMWCERLLVDRVGRFLRNFPYWRTLSPFKME